MKKVFFIISLIFIFFVLTGCGKNTHCVNYFVDEKIVKTEIVNHSAKATYGVNNLPHKKDYDFLHWTINDYPYNFDTIVTSDLNLVASFKKHKVLVSFVVKLDDEEILINTQEVTVGERVNYILPSLNHDYLSVENENWYLDGNVFDFNSKITSPIKLVNTFLKKKFSVTTNILGSVNTFEACFNERLSYETHFPKPFFANHELIGWFETKQNLFYDDINKVIVSKDLELFPVFSYDLPDSVNVTFQVNEKTIILKQKKNQKINFICSPFLPGYKFKSWVVNDTEINNNFILTSDVTITTLFTPNNSKDTFAEICALQKQTVNGETGYFIIELLDRTIKTLTIPDTFNNLPILGIDINGLLGADSIEQLYLGKNCKKLYLNACANMKNLTKVIGLEHAEVIGENCFAGCEKLVYVSLPTSHKFKEVTNQLFLDCKNLTKIDIPDNITRIGIRSFKNCTSLYKINLGTNITVIDKEAFMNCESLNNISCLKKLVYINDSIFENCYLLQNIEISNNLISIGKKAFKNCLITNFNTPSLLKIVKDEAFAGCKYLTSITLGNNLKELGSGAFRNCEKLEEIKIDSLSFSTGTELVDNTIKLKKVILKKALKDNYEISFFDNVNAKTPNIEYVE